MEILQHSPHQSPPRWLRWSRLPEDKGSWKRDTILSQLPHHNLQMFRTFEIFKRFTRHNARKCIRIGSICDTETCWKSWSWTFRVAAFWFGCWILVELVFRLNLGLITCGNLIVLLIFIFRLDIYIVVWIEEGGITSSATRRGRGLVVRLFRGFH